MESRPRGRRGSSASRSPGPSDPGTVLQARATALVSAYQAVGVPSFPTAIPLATEVLTEATYLDLVTNPRFGVAGDSLETWRSPWELGDVEVHAYARLWEMGQRTGLDEPEPSRLVRAPYGDPSVGCLESLVGSAQRMGRTQRPR